MLFGLFAGEAPAARPVARPAPMYGLEPLEGRVFMSAAPNLAVEEVDSLKDLNKVPQLTQQLRNAGVNLGRLVNIAIQGVTGTPTLNAVGNLTGTLNALVTLPGGQATTIPVTWTLERPAAAHTAHAGDVATQQLTEIDCPILNLELGPIDLNVLGLRVETSEICLRIGANEGPGNLLGNLLCGLTGLLDNPLGNLTSIIGGLNRLLPVNLGVTLDELTRQGTDIVGLGTLSLGIGGQSITQQLRLPLFGEHATPRAACPILNLDVGPLDLNLLGLIVQLDNCDEGPVEVDITAVPGPGNLLGNLLCGIAGVLDGGLNLGQLNRLIRNVNRLLDRLDDLL